MRMRVRNLETEVAKARSERYTWQAVSEVIGSRSGEKFVQIAQAVTLAILVDGANAHLAALSRATA
jgi:DNA repair protein SbcC/Rad50